MHTNQIRYAKGPGTFFPIYALDPRLRSEASPTIADASRLSIGRWWCRRAAVFIRRWRCRCAAVFIRCRRCWSSPVRHNYGTVAVRRNDGFQAHSPYQNEHGKEYNCEFLGHFASGDGRHPETLYPLLQGCQGTRATNLFRISTHLPGPSLRWTFARCRWGRQFTTPRE